MEPLDFPTAATARVWARCGSFPDGAAMKLDETMETAYPRKYLEHIVIGLEDALNKHLVKLFAFDFPAETRADFRREVRAWLDKLQRLRLKPDGRTGSAKFYFDLLFDYPFCGVEVQNMRIIMEFISEEYDGIKATNSPQKVVAWLKEFHTVLAERLHRGEAVLDLVPE
jgi:hypothetical protein